MLMIDDINESEKVDRFINGLKYFVKVEVLKNSVSSFEECAQMALNIDSAIWRARITNSEFNANRPTDRDGPTPMEIGNMNSMNYSRAARGHRTRKCKQKGACFKCHKAGCRPWKCDPSRVNNIAITDNDLENERNNVVLSDPENE